MPDAIRIECWGKPEPAGSKTAFPLKNKTTGKYLTAEGGRPIINVVDDNPKSKPWKILVARHAAEQYTGDLMEGAVRCFMTFYLCRPKGHYGTGRNERILKDSAPLHHGTKPDALKLARGVEDALTGVVWTDDALVHRGGQRKVYVDAWGTPGVVVEVTREPLLTVGDERAAAQTSLLSPAA